MAAAIQAVAEGTDPSKILVLEKGGAEKSALSGESFNAADTDEQAEAGIEDSVDALSPILWRQAAERTARRWWSIWRRADGRPLSG